MEYAYKIIDTHAHYDDEQFDEDRNKLLQDLRKDGVIGIVNCSSSYESIAKTIDIVNTYDYIYGAFSVALTVLLLSITSNKYLLSCIPFIIK